MLIEDIVFIVLVFMGAFYCFMLLLAFQSSTRITETEENSDD